jgi:twitching motility protein PilT
MEQLNQFLQQLVDTSSYELHLEPNKNPYVLNAQGQADVATAPLLGTHISMMVFPLIPAEVKSQLPNKPEINFVHPHSLGKFGFTIQKSPSGFNVTVRPIIGDFPANAPPEEISLGSEPEAELEMSPDPEPADIVAPERSPVTEPLTPPFELESASLAAESAPLYEPETVSFVEVEAIPVVETALQNSPIPEVVSANDPQFQTVFSDTSTYEPPGRRDDFGFEPNTFSSDVEFAPQQQYEQPQRPADYQPAVELPPVDRRQGNRRERNLMATARMDVLFKLMAEYGASDLHLSVSMPPMVRKDGKMKKLECGEGQLDDVAMRELLVSIMPDKNQDEFDRRHDTDFAYEIPGLARFRCNVFMDRKGMGGVFRIIPSEILTAEKLGLSKAIMDLCALSKGLVVVTGPTGSGKSTTLCAMVDSINKTREDHIITIEDPIEFVHENQSCLVNQREVHNHTDSFKDALRAALREDPDILLVGEMRDLETISIAIETAETGHLVFGTLHTTTAPSTVDRIIDQFPADRQQQIRVMLSESLKGVIAQTLLPKIGGGRVAALEILIVTPAISNLIREGKTFQIQSAMQTGKNHGMVMLNDALFDLVQKKLVEPRDAYIKAVDKTNFESMLTRAGFKI